jgi:hypothetical protein
MMLRFWLNADSRKSYLAPAQLSSGGCGIKNSPCLAAIVKREALLRGNFIASF